MRSTLTRLTLATCLAGAAFAAAPPSVAQSVNETQNSEWRYLQSDEFLQIDDWDALRQRVVAAFGVEEVPEIPFEEVGPLGSDEPEVFIATSGDLSLLSLMRAPEDVSILSELADLFADLTTEDVEGFQDGLVIQATDIGDGIHDLAIYFFLEGGFPTRPIRPESASAGGAAIDEPTVPERVLDIVPEDSVEVVALPDAVGGGVFVFESPSSLEDLLEAFTELLDTLELEYEIFERDGVVLLRTEDDEPHRIQVQLAPSEESPGYTSVLLIFGDGI